MMRYIAPFFACVGVMALSFLPRTSYAHCQVPCGIYDDHARIHQIYEDIVTIEKAAQQINALAGKTDAISAQQLVRWVLNKEKHAEQIIRTICDYFLAQKIKDLHPKDKGYPNYLSQLARHHAVIRAAMNAKQSASLVAVQALRKAVDLIAVDWAPKKK